MECYHVYEWLTFRGTALNDVLRSERDTLRNLGWMNCIVLQPHFPHLLPRAGPTYRQAESYFCLLMACPRRSLFRPCIDLHDGHVKQIVGGTLSETDPGSLKTNFIAKYAMGAAVVW